MTLECYQDRLLGTSYQEEVSILIPILQMRKLALSFLWIML